MEIDAVAFAPPVSRKRSFHFRGGHELLRFDGALPGAAFNARHQQQTSSRKSTAYARRRRLPGIQQIPARDYRFIFESWSRSNHHVCDSCAVGRLMGFCGSGTCAQSNLGCRLENFLARKGADGRNGWRSWLVAVTFGGGDVCPHCPSRNDWQPAASADSELSVADLSRQRILASAVRRGKLFDHCCALCAGLSFHASRRGYVERHAARSIRGRIVVGVSEVHIRLEPRLFSLRSDLWVGGRRGRGSDVELRVEFDNAVWRPTHRRLPLRASVVSQGLHRKILGMQISDFDYELPAELIAQKPLEERDASRMLVLDRREQSWSDSSFKDFTRHLRRQDVVVVNNSRVIPARLIGHRDTGGHVEIFLVRELENQVWEALVRPGSRLKKDSRVTFGEGKLIAEILDEPGAELRQVRFCGEGPFDKLLAEIGSTPLPPYIKRPSGASVEDRERYQTIYSKHRGAIAAPTAGLHFTPEVLAEVAATASLAEITLHVGYGTFEPVRVEDVTDHSVSGEYFEISESAAQTINDARANDGRVVVVGTTTMRALESSAAKDRRVQAGRGLATLTIKPGHRFQIADALLTNFHLPRSSLLILASAFAGRDFVLRAYCYAVEQRYRFYSYGDCMLIL